MGYYAIGEDPGGKVTGRWRDNTNKAFKNQLVRLAIGTVRQFEYLHSANDLPFGVLQREGTYNEMLEAASEGIVICINSKAGTVNIGDPVVYDYTNSGGTVGKVMSGVVGPVGGRGQVGTNWSAGTYFVTVPQPVTYPIKPGSIRFGTWTDATNVRLVEGMGGTAFRIEIVPGWANDVYHYQIDQPVIGFAMDKANSPNDKFRVKLARQNDIKANTAW